jgi:thiosulfate/3-mercaptopyruvate sulfurtransferase
LQSSIISPVAFIFTQAVITMSNLPLLIEANELKQHLQDENLLIIDLSREQVYQQAHIPGAIFLDFKKLVCGVQPATGKLPDEAMLSSLFSELGLEEHKHVIAYDDEGGGWAGRLIWTLDCIGHTHYSYLNGGIHAWLAEQLPVEQNAQIPKPSTYQAKVNNSAKVDKAFLLENLHSKDLCIWDARSKEEYTGTKAFAAKAGHIPGAKHYEWTTAMDKENALRIRQFDELEAELVEAGIDKNVSVVTHCQTHHRSGFTYLLGKVLGFKDIKAYDGSWSEWGNDPDTPVEL